MSSSNGLRIVFFGLSGTIFTLLAFFTIWCYLHERVMGHVMLFLLLSSLMLFVWVYRYTTGLIRLHEEENRMAEQKVMGYSARLTSFLENPKYVSIYSLDRNYCYTGFNSLHKEKMQRHFQQDIREGSNILEHLPEKYYKASKLNYDRALSGERFTVTSMFDDRYFTQVFNPVYDEHNEIIGLTINIFDVTERIHAEQELENYKDQLEILVKERTEQLEHQTVFFQQIIDNLPNLIFVRDQDHRYILVNQAMADSFGCTKEELIGEGIIDTHHDPERAKAFEKEDDQLIAYGGVVEEEGQHTWPDGSKKWLFLSKRRMEIGENYYILGVHFDITYLKDTEHKLQDANAELQQTLDKLKSTQLRLIESEKMASLGQLTAGLAHEINNPLNYVAGNVGPIREDLTELKTYIKSLEDFKFSVSKKALSESVELPDTDFDVLFEELESLLAGVDEGTARVKSLMDDLNMFSLPEGSRKVLYDVNVSLQSTINLVRHHLKSKIKLITSFGNIPKTLCNPQQINQVFLNILNNSIQAIDEKGMISVKSEEADGQIIVSIADTGAGISEENLGKIFEPFYTTKQVGEGTGLGLAISYRIIKEHGGTIEVSSQVGEGTLSKVTLPVVYVS